MTPCLHSHRGSSEEALEAPSKICKQARMRSSSAKKRVGKRGRLREQLQQHLLSSPRLWRSRGAARLSNDLERLQLEEVAALDVGDAVEELTLRLKSRGVDPAMNDECYGCMSDSKFDLKVSWRNMLPSMQSRLSAQRMGLAGGRSSSS